MKFTTVLFSAALIAGVSAASTATTTSTAPVNTDSSYGPQVDACMDDCEETDVSCRATCLGSPNPTEEQINETTKCSAKCPQGNGTEAETKAYGDCQRACVEKYFLPNPSNVPSMGSTETADSDGPVATDSEGNPTETDTDTNSNGNGSATVSPTSSPTGNAASTNVYSASFAGVVAAFAAFFAL